MKFGLMFSSDSMFAWFNFLIALKEFFFHLIFWIGLCMLNNIYYGIALQGRL